jgi:hypothetical protein
MKYDAQIDQLKNLLPNSQNILISLSTNPSIDELAASLSLFLSLKQANKKVAIATKGIIRVEHTNLFGVGEIMDKLPETKGGNFTVTLGGVVVGGVVPALQNLDWSPTGPGQKDLKLVFHVAAGQNFEPTSINYGHEGGNFEIIFCLGVVSLDNLGGLYQNNPQVFTNSFLANIDNKTTNTQFGTANIVDPASSSISEIIGQIIPALQLPLDNDMATNLLTGIFTATNNLTSGQVNADTYEVVSQALRAGGQKPIISTIFATPQPQPQSQPAAFDLSKLFQTNVASGAKEALVENLPQPSPEEVPVAEIAISPEDDWLTPKIYKGSVG